MRSQLAQTHPHTQADTHMHTIPPHITVTDPLSRCVCARAGGRCVGLGGVGGLFEFIEGMCVFVYGCVCVCVCACAGGAGIQNCVWVWGLRCMYRWSGCGVFATVVHKWYEFHPKFLLNLYPNCINLVPISSLKCLKCRQFECACYEFHTNFVQT